ncbi:hypothetical protein [Magnetococcus sp. PR-3]|uniref:hypothetical protein n=1 Tax=Magnetococcus sp. PR-3 TaxID=3120355 RepID=UPI002FCE3376
MLLSCLMLISSGCTLNFDGSSPQSDAPAKQKAHQVEPSQVKSKAPRVIPEGAVAQPVKKTSPTKQIQQQSLPSAHVEHVDVGSSAALPRPHDVQQSASPNMMALVAPKRMAAKLDRAPRVRPVSHFNQQPIINTVLMDRPVSFSVSTLHKHIHRFIDEKRFEVISGPTKQSHAGQYTIRYRDTHFSVQILDRPLPVTYFSKTLEHSPDRDLYLKLVRGHRGHLITRPTTIPKDMNQFLTIADDTMALSYILADQGRPVLNYWESSKRLIMWSRFVMYKRALGMVFERLSHNDPNAFDYLPIRLWVRFAVEKQSGLYLLKSKGLKRFTGAELERYVDIRRGQEFLYDSQDEILEYARYWIEMGKRIEPGKAVTLANGHRFVGVVSQRDTGFITLK